MDSMVVKGRRRQMPSGTPNRKKLKPTGTSIRKKLKQAGSPTTQKCLTIIISMFLVSTATTVTAGKHLYQDKKLNLSYKHKIY